MNNGLNRCYSAPELFDLLNHHHFDTELFGAFPIPQGSARLTQRIRKNIIAMGVKTLDLFNFLPGMRVVRRLLKKLIGHKTLVLPQEIVEG